MGKFVKVKSAIVGSILKLDGISYVVCEDYDMGFLYIRSISFNQFWTWKKIICLENVPIS